MIRMPRLGLRTRSVVLLAVYTLAIESTILASYRYFGGNSIELRSDQELGLHAERARNAVNAALSASLAELRGLRAQLRTYPSPVSPAVGRVLAELVAASPRQYAEIAIFDSVARRAFAVRPVTEMEKTYAVSEIRNDEPALADCPDSPAPCITAPTGRNSPEVLQIALPLVAGGTTVLVARLNTGYLLDDVAALPAAPSVSVLAFDLHGLIRQAPDVSLLRTDLRRSDPRLAAAALPTPRTGVLRLQQQRPVRLQPLEQAGLVLAISRDETRELAELRAAILQVAAFTAALTLLCLLAVWVATGRMAASLRHVAEVANRVASGDFSRRIAIRRTDELGTLIDSFNAMTGRLDASYSELRQVNRELRENVLQLRRTRRLLSQKQRLALVGQAISTVSHEIQNRIGAASVWVQNLQRYGSRDDTTALCADELDAALRAFRDMLARFKRFYGSPTPAAQRIDAGELMDASLARVCAELAEKQLAVERTGFDRPLWLSVDPAQVGDAIVNLLLNAVHFSPSGGTLHVASRCEDGYAILRFEDHGPGIPPQARLFQPFFSTRPGGSGLGLAIVRNIVHAHSGRVRAFNLPAGGACFEIKLPVAEVVPE
jgi:signal transduction histidine kinase